MQKIIAFCPEKGIDMVKLGCTSPKMANIYLNKLTEGKFYSFMNGDKKLLEKNQEEVVGGPYIVFTRKTVVDETFFRKSTNKNKSVVETDASQLYLHSMSQPMPSVLYTRWDLDSETVRITPRENKTYSFENMVM